MPRSPLFAALVLTTLAALPAAAAADRSPTKAERRAIERKALKTCRAAAPGECETPQGPRLDRNARFAWADVVGEGFSGVLLKRATGRAHRFRVAGTQGAGTCVLVLARACPGRRPARPARLRARRGHWRGPQLRQA